MMLQTSYKGTAFLYAQFWALNLNEDHAITIQPVHIYITHFLQPNVWQMFTTLFQYIPFNFKGMQISFCNVTVILYLLAVRSS